MTKKTNLIVKALSIIMLMLLSLPIFAFEGSQPENGKKYYLFNIYQAKFLGSDCKLQSPNIGSPLGFTISNNTIAIGGKTWTLSPKDNYYQMKNGSLFFAFEDKVADAENPSDENRALYLGGGVTCQPSANDTDRSYWQLISESEYEVWNAKKKFTVASLNVDGMPKSLSLDLGVYKKDFELNPDAKEGPGATEIGNKMRESGFDIVGVSEDFNYHSELWDAAWNNGSDVHYNSTTHVQKLSQSTATLTNYLTQKPLFTTDGLCLFYRVGEIDQQMLESSEQRYAWNDHYGYTDNGADGLITKGYRYYIVKLNDGTEIDLYTMHMDAESSAEDNAARESQMKQIVAAIKASNNKRPIIIIGDTNCRYTRDNIKEYLIDLINMDSRFTIRDPWITFGRNNAYPRYNSPSIMASENGYLKGEVVDKIWYINNTESTIRLVAETYCQDLSFVDAEGSPLCDHKPCVVTFSYHDYDPLIDDVAIIETTAEPVYLRNRETGRYLMNGGWWGAHAVVGNYAKPYYISALPNGKYDITSAYGHLTDAAYVDNNNTAEYIAEWNIIEHEGYKVLSYNQNGTQKALTTNDPAYFNNDPLYRYVTTATLNVQDKCQQWEIVTKEMLDAEIEKASSSNPINVTHLVKSANFDRIDWNEHASWVFNNIGGTYRVTDNGINGADNDDKCNYNRSVNTQKYYNSNNQWDCYQELLVPAGYYVITNQGLEKGTQCTKLYAWSNPEGAYKEESVNLATYNSADFTDGDTPTNAARAFDASKYQNVLPVVQVGTDGKLVIGVKKTENNSTSGWSVFDNFQLYYLGTKNPNRMYSYDVIASSVLIGDVDKDGDIDLLDVESLSNIILRNSPFNINGDINKDNKLSIEDLSLLIQMLMKQE